MEDKNTVKQQFIELRAKGNSYDKIADTLKVSKPTLITWSKELTAELSNHIGIETDALLERHKMAKIHQLELYGIQLAKVRSELEKRDLSDVSTDKLLNMELKILNAINATEGGGLSFKEFGVLFLNQEERRWNA